MNAYSTPFNSIVLGFTSSLLLKCYTESLIAPIDIAYSTCKLNRDPIMTGNRTNKMFICMTKYTLNTILET